MSAEEDPHGGRSNANRDAQHGHHPHSFSKRRVRATPLEHPGVPTYLIERRVVSFERAARQRRRSELVLLVSGIVQDRQQ